MSELQPQPPQRRQYVRHEQRYCDKSRTNDEPNEKIGPVLPIVQAGDQKQDTADEQPKRLYCCRA